jgi:oxygen-independent coproporphyrinogen-3 oxidase
MPRPAIQHLYVHIPFCHRICPYCSFYKHTPGSVRMGAFVDAILAELRDKAGRFDLDLRTIYLGGGTPTLLPRPELARLLVGLRECAGQGGLDEFGIEANPMTYDLAKARAIRDAGVTRVSLGVQSWDPATLATLGRDHTPDQAGEAFATLREGGFTSVNLDLMFSIPGQRLDSWESDLAHAIALQPDHISAYNLNYEEDTEFFERLTRGEYREDSDADVGFFTAAMDRLGEAGFEHYEISNYAQPGHQSAHNRAYWEGSDYLGLGPGAFSTAALTRWKNVPDTAEYMRRAIGGIDPASESEDLSEADFRTERIALELRTARGVALETIGDDREREIADFLEGGLIRNAGGRLSLTESGKLLADSVAEALL